MKTLHLRCMLRIIFTPGNGQGDTLLVVFVCKSGQSRWQSFVHPSLMPGLVAKAVLCLGLIKIKSAQAAQRRRRKTDRPTDLHVTHSASWRLMGREE